MKAFYILGFLIFIPIPGWTFQQEGLVEEERVYISMDKPYHAAGEHMAFTAFLFHRVTHQLKEAPGILHLELFHPEGEKIISQVIRTQKGIGQGIFLLPDTLSGGVYRLAAFTQKMALEEEPAIAWKEIVIDGEKILKKNRNSRNQAVQLLFFPESGTFVEGVESLVGVRISGGVSTEIAAKGDIFNDKGAVVARFSTSKTGRGSFLFTPEPGFAYYGKITVKGQGILADLPPAEKEGFTLAVDDTTPDSLRINVESSPSFYGRKFLVRIESRGAIIMEAKGQARYHGFRVKVPVASLLPGLAWVQLLSEEGGLLANRPVYLDEQRSLSVTISSSREEYRTRSEVYAKIKLKDEKGQPVKAVLAASVFDKKFAVPEMLEPDIRTLMLGAGEGKSLPKFPDLPKPNQLEEAKEVDEFLLTAFADTLPVYKPKIKKGKLNILSGRVLYKGKAEPLADATLIAGVVSAGQEAPVLLFAKTDKKGRFEITIPATGVSKTVFLKVKGIDDLQETVEYQFDRTKDHSLRPERRQGNSRFDMQNSAGYYRVFKENRIINQAYSSSPLKIVRNNADSLEGYSFRNFDATYKMDEYLELETLKEIIINVVSGVRVVKGRDKPELAIKGKDFSSGKLQKRLPGQPLLLLDGIPVFNASLLLGISPAEIEKIEVAHATWYFDDVPVHGIFSVTTKNKGIYQRKDINHYSYTSAGAPSSIQYEFIRHKGSEGFSAHTPDFRPLLYYKPHERTNELGEIALRFYAADNTGTFRIFVEGVTEDGRPFSGFKDFEVNNFIE